MKKEMTVAEIKELILNRINEIDTSKKRHMKAFYPSFPGEDGLDTYTTVHRS